MAEDIQVKLRDGMLLLEDLGKQTPKSLESAFNDENEKIDKIRERLAMLIAGNPKDLMTKYDEDEYGTVTRFIEEKINEVMNDANEAYSKIERLSILENILDEWDGKCFRDDYKEWMFDHVNFEDNAQINAFVYPEQKLNEEVEKENIDVEFYGKPHKSNTFAEIYANGLKNIAMNDQIRNQIEEMVVSYVDDMLFVMWNGKFAFKTKEEAFAAIKDQMRPNVTNRFMQSYFTNEQENAKKFFNDVKANLESQTTKGQVDTCVEKMKEDRSFMSKEMSTLYNIANEAFDNFLKKHVTFAYLKKNK